MRAAIAALAILVTGVLALLTLIVLFTHGPDPLLLVSLVIVAVLGFGVAGALAHPPDEPD
jgi:hypothetical protein